MTAVLKIWFLSITQSISNICTFSLLSGSFCKNYTKKNCFKIGFWVCTFVKQLSKNTKKKNSKILSFFLIFENFFFWKMAGFFEQNFNFSLFYQNFTKTIFFKYSKRPWLRKVWTNKKWWPWILWLQAKKPDFHVSTVKSRNNQIWSFLFKGFNLAHRLKPLQILSF
jgi:hypothetical protein